MSIDAKIKTALGGICGEPYSQVYMGDEEEYIVFNHSEYPLVAANNVTRIVGYSIQVHLFMPLNANPNTKKAGIRNAIIAAGFSYPTVLDMSDGDGRHFVFETTYREAV